MALKKDMTLPSGLTVPGAYVRVAEVRGSKAGLSITVDAFANEDYAQNEKPWIEPRREFAFVPSVEEGAPNFIKQAYEHLKTLSEFKGAEDV